MGYSKSIPSKFLTLKIKLIIMKNSLRVLSGGILFILSCNVLSQPKNPYDYTFSEYSDLMNMEFGIICKIPRTFVDQKHYEPWRIKENKSDSPGYVYSPIVRSKDKECMLLYPYSPVYITEMDYRMSEAVNELNRTICEDNTPVKRTVTNENLPRNNIMAEVKTAFGIPRDSVFDVNNYLTVLAGKEARNMFNADSVFLYDLPLDRPYKEKYVYCKGMVISKRNRPAMLIKWFFTEKGKRKERKYINLLNKTIWYEDQK